MNRMDPRVLRNIARSSPHLANQISSQMNMGRIPTGPALPAPTSMPVAAPVANPYPATAGAAPMDPRVMRNIERSNPAAAQTITNNMRGYDPAATTPNPFSLDAGMAGQFYAPSEFRPPAATTPNPTGYAAPYNADEQQALDQAAAQAQLQLQNMQELQAYDQNALATPTGAYTPTGPAVDFSTPPPPQMTPQAQMYAQQRAQQDEQDAMRRMQVQSSMASRQAQADASRRAQVDARAQQRALQDERTRMAGLRSQQYQANRPATSYTPQPMPSLTPNSGIGGLMGAGSAPAWGQPQNAPQQGPLQVSQPPAQPGFSKGAGMTRGIGSLPFGANMPRFDR